VASLRETERTSQNHAGGPPLGAVLDTITGVANPPGKIQRLIRELVAVLVDEFGPENAAQMLERTAAQVRRTGDKPTHVTVQEKDQLRTGRKLAQVIELKR